MSLSAFFSSLNSFFDPTSDDRDENESADSADGVDELATLADAQASTAEAQRQIRLDATAAFAAHAGVDSYAALALLG